jgi:hypothetical protein
MVKTPKKTVFGGVPASVVLAAQKLSKKEE